jgi:hypothetical protein
MPRCRIPARRSHRSQGLDSCESPPQNIDTPPYLAGLAFVSSLELDFDKSTNCLYDYKTDRRSPRSDPGAKEVLRSLNQRLVERPPARLVSGPTRWTR